MKHIIKEIALVFRISNFYLFYSFIVFFLLLFFALHVHAPLALCYVSTFRFDVISYPCLMSCKTGFPRWNIIINLFMHKNVDTLYALKIELRPVISERLWSFTWTCIFKYLTPHEIIYYILPSLSVESLTQNGDFTRRGTHLETEDVPRSPRCEKQATARGSIFPRRLTLKGLVWWPKAVNVPQGPFKTVIHIVMSIPKFHIYNYFFKQSCRLSL